MREAWYRQQLRGEGRPEKYARYDAMKENPEGYVLSRLARKVGESQDRKDFAALHPVMAQFFFDTISQAQIEAGAQNLLTNQ